MTDFTRLDAAILDSLRQRLSRLHTEVPDVALVACGMVEDLTGFFVSAASASWLGALPGDAADRAQLAWFPSEWPESVAVDGDDVTAAIWALSGTQALIDGTGDELDDDAYDALRADYEARIVLALERVREEGLLRGADGRVAWVWLHSADASDEELDDRSFALLQAPEIAAEFDGRFGDGSERLLARIAAHEPAPR